MTRRPSLSSPPPMMMSGPLDLLLARSVMMSVDLQVRARSAGVGGWRARGPAPDRGAGAGMPHQDGAASGASAPGAALLAGGLDLHLEARLEGSPEIEHLLPHRLDVGGGENHQ